eukprot:12896264-Prorocentrum_lima.AAC.1
MLASDSFSKAMTDLEKVLERIKEAEGKLAFSKCRFVTRKLCYLGHDVSDEGIRPSADRIEVIQKCERPRTIKQVKSFIGICSFYRRYIEGFSNIAEPLLALLKKDSIFTWEQPQEAAWQKLKNALSSRPVLAHPDLNKPFILKTDASGEAISGILCQLDENQKEKVIQYASRKLTETEQKWGATEKEGFAFYWMVTNQFKKYLYGR